MAEIASLTGKVVAADAAAGASQGVLNIQVAAGEGAQQVGFISVQQTAASVAAATVGSSCTIVISQP